MPAIRERDIEKGRRDFLTCQKALKHQAAIASASSSSSSLTDVTLPTDSSNPDFVPRPVIAMAVRYTLAILEKAAPGPSTEVRVAPYAAVKIFPGPDSDPHNLTPPDVVEIDPATWLRLACGVTSWQQEKAAGHVAPIGKRDEQIGRLVPIRA
jgi:hypothetical protein